MCTHPSDQTLAYATEAACGISELKDKFGYTTDEAIKVYQLGFINNAMDLFKELMLLDL